MHSEECRLLTGRYLLVSTKYELASTNHSFRLCLLRSVANSLVAKLFPSRNDVQVCCFRRRPRCISFGFCPRHPVSYMSLSIFRRLEYSPSSVSQFRHGLKTWVRSSFHRFSYVFNFPTNPTYYFTYLELRPPK
jgi:hypothetical protein